MIKLVNLQIFELEDLFSFLNIKFNQPKLLIEMIILHFKKRTFYL
jgi:hypothetical protein